jgi:glycosyltransferase involved in cell wall biosynthesis
MRCYFVQDFEPYFFAPGSQYAFAEQTYRWGFHGITAGRWLAHKLQVEYGMPADWIGFSYDRDLYRPLGKARSGQDVFFYARRNTHRRGFELGLLVLADVARRLPKTRFLLAGDDQLNAHIPFRHKCFGSLPLSRLAQLYSRCDAALVLSFTNLSLLPLELMACGCPVVSNTGPNVEWLLNAENCVLAEPSVESLSDALVGLLTDAGRRHELSQKGLRFARHTDWAEEAGKVAAILERLSHGQGP